jgi:hypothetical protein
MSWQAVGAEIGVSGPVVFRAVARGQLPKSRAMRRKLGLIAPTKPRTKWKQVANCERVRAETLAALLKRLGEWDVIVSGGGDGPYWKREIDAALLAQGEGGER